MTSLAVHRADCPVCHAKDIALSYPMRRLHTHDRGFRNSPPRGHDLASVALRRLCPASGKTVEDAKLIAAREVLENAE